MTEHTGQQPQPDTETDPWSVTGYTAPQPQAEHPEADLGLTPGQWHDLAYAYNHGLLEPEPGTIEDKAFSQMDRYARQETGQTAAADAAGKARQASRQGSAPQAGPEPEAG